ncbi:MAG: hypothetical protein ACRCRP_02575 [Metamycoplasmataceae bacterium]
MEKIECIKSSSIKEIIKIENNLINIVYRTNINKKYTYRINSNYWNELLQFHKMYNGLGMNKKISFDLKQGIKIFKLF